jgi:WD40 repeat protein
MTSTIPWLFAAGAACLAPSVAGGSPPAPTHTRPVTACAFSPDGKSLVAVQSDVILDLSSADATLQRTLKPDLQRITAVAFGGGGGLLAVAGGVPGESGRVLLLDWESGRVVAAADGFPDVTTSVAFSPDGSTLAAGAAEGSVRLYAIHDAPEHLKLAARLEGHAGPVLSVVFGNNGASVVTASADRSIKVWDAETGKLTGTLSNHTDVVHCLTPRPSAGADGDSAPFSCASGSDDRTVRVWQPAIGRMVRIVRGHEGPVFSVCYAPDGNRLFSAGAEGVVRVIDAGSDRIVRQWNASTDWIYTVAVSPDGKRLATGDWAGSVRLWGLGIDATVRQASYPPAKVAPTRGEHQDRHRPAASPQ